MKVFEISSGANRVFKIFQDLLESKGIQKHSQALISGQKAVSEVIHNKSLDIIGVIRTLKMPAIETAYSDACEYLLSEQLFKTLDVHGTHYPLLLVRFHIPNLSEAKIPSGIQVALPFQDPANVGAAIRSSAAFGVSTILLLPGCAHPFHPKSSRAASGTLGLIKFFRLQSWEELRTLGPPVWGLSMTGEPLGLTKKESPLILVPGIEGPGLPERIKLDRQITIPMAEGVESLNGAIALSLALFHLNQ
ncbi:MAG: RNA methyltransferase [Oligoflexia bacterium]|nr:RNA methyltransferase [Oligoflexia bacterium]